MSGLDGRVALVTGGGRNLGRAVALALAGAGARVAVGVRANRAEGEAVVAEVCTVGAEALMVVGDLSDATVVDELVGEVERGFGAVEVLVHCAATRPRLTILETSIEEWHRVQDTNASSYFYLVKRVLPAMRDSGFGRIIGISGPDANHGNRLHGAIAASKAGLVALSRVVAVEHGADGITANIVSPTITETTAPEHVTPELLQQRLAIPRPGRLDEIAAACLFLASDQAAYITGETLRVDGGFES